MQVHISSNDGHMIGMVHMMQVVNVMSCPYMHAASPAWMLKGCQQALFACAVQSDSGLLLERIADTPR